MLSPSVIVWISQRRDVHSGGVGSKFHDSRREQIVLIWDESMCFGVITTAFCGLNISLPLIPHTFNVV